MEPLTNERWGFASSCFVCEPTNAHGLQIPFFHDVEGRRVVAKFTLGATHSGAPSYAHGGVVMAVADEAMAWAAIAVSGKWAVTSSASTDFARPVRIGRLYEIEAHIVSDEPGVIEAEAVIADDKGRTCAVSRASFTPLGEAQAVDAIGTAVKGHDQSFVDRG